MLLTFLALAVQAYGDSHNRLFALTNLWLAATVIFSTGLHLPRTCFLIVLVCFPCIIAACLALDLTNGLLSFCWLLIGVGAFLLVFSYVMARIHREVFLQESILIYDKQRLQDLSEALAEMSLKDALTGVSNRRHFDEVLGHEWGRAQRQQSSLALLFIDVDHFKRYNDHYGHQAGDDCLRAVALVLVDSGRRPSDRVARYGGEEFVLLLPDCDATGALEAAHRIHEFLAQVALPHAKSEHGHVTVSIGVAALTPAASSQANDIVMLADEALYRAKEKGRNRAELA